MAEDEKRRTCSIMNRLGRTLRLDPHMTVADDGAGRAFLGREGEKGVTLQPGANVGLDKEFVDTWLQQNPGVGFLDYLTITDDPEPDSADSAKE